MRDALDDLIARVGDGVHRMAEADDGLLALQATADILLRLIGILVTALNLQREIGPQVVGLALQRGLLINAPRTDTLRFMPALTVTRQEIDRMIAILGEVLKMLRTEI